MRFDAARVAEVLGGEKVLGRAITSLADLEALVAVGLPSRTLIETVRYVAGSGQEGRVLMDRMVPRATRARRGKLLRRVESERVERVARLMAMAEEVWEDREDARAFLREEHPMLDGRSPLELAATDLGARRVERLLTQLEYGLPV